jgi:hypothetical protein
MYSDCVYLLPVNWWLWSLGTFFGYSVYGKCVNVSMEHCWCDSDGKIEVLEENPVPVPLCPPQIPYWLAWNQTSTFVVGNWWLTPWIINDSLHFVVMNFVLVTEMGMYPLAVCQYSTIFQNVNISLLFQLCSSCPGYRIQPFTPFSVMRAEYDSWPR